MDESGADDDSRFLCFGFHWSNKVLRFFMKKKDIKEGFGNGGDEDGLDG